MASFQLKKPTDRESVYYPRGSMELIRQSTPHTNPQVWVLTPDDIEALKIVCLLYTSDAADD